MFKVLIERQCSLSPGWWGLGLDHKIYTGISRQNDVPRPRKQGRSHGPQYEYQDCIDWLYSGVHAEETKFNAERMIETLLM